MRVTQRVESGFVMDGHAGGQPWWVNQCVNFLLLL